MIIVNTVLINFILRIAAMADISESQSKVDTAMQTVTEYLDYLNIDQLKQVQRAIKKKIKEKEEDQVVNQIIDAVRERHYAWYPIKLNIKGLLVDCYEIPVILGPRAENDSDEEEDLEVSAIDIETFKKNIGPFYDDPQLDPGLLTSLPVEIDSSSGTGGLVVMYLYHRRISKVDICPVVAYSLPEKKYYVIVASESDTLRVYRQITTDSIEIGDKVYVLPADKIRKKEYRTKVAESERLLITTSQGEEDGNSLAFEFLETGDIDGVSEMIKVNLV